MMTLIEDREQWVALVGALQRGDVAAWPALIERFEDLVVASDARITFDLARARARRWPAIDPERTSARTYPDVRHERIAGAARAVLADYTAADPSFALPDPDTFADPAAARRAQTLVQYLTQSIRPFEMLSATPAPDTPSGELLDTVEALLGA